MQDINYMIYKKEFGAPKYSRIATVTADVLSYTDTNIELGKRYIYAIKAKSVDGIISGVTEFGIFVELPNTVEGLVKIEDVSSKEYFFYNEKLQALIGKKSNKRYMFGDSVKVEVIAASKETGLIDFALVNENGDKGGNTK